MRKKKKKKAVLGAFKKKKINSGRGGPISLRFGTRGLSCICVRLGLRKQHQCWSEAVFPSHIPDKKDRPVRLCEAVASSLVSNPHDGSLSDLEIDFLINI